MSVVNVDALDKSDLVGLTIKQDKRGDLVTEGTTSSADPKCAMEKTEWARLAGFDLSSGTYHRH